MKELLPAIDLKDGKVVRLTKGDFSQQSTYDIDPLTVLQKFYTLGFKKVHVVNLDGALQGKFKNTSNFSVIKKLIEFTTTHYMTLEIGGGIRDEKTVDLLVSFGVSRIILGSLAIENIPLLKELVQKYGNKITVGFDVLDESIKTSF